ncbi:MAG: cob(I)yrinic acid a,c-diamide adenosyltransferase [Bacteroidia bacterium]|nr:cob(I)yrinic acid a,c-diamide adenosyltransferase [Bacteroidia bacterium]MCZ2278309.1 cob(I)yrinic acid a,c-diamide adenosyltransferase [Bacteroidia bacterium]
MKIYTRKGDAGTTSLIGGTKVPKDSLFTEAYGTVDELNAWVGLILDNIETKEEKTTLPEIQDRLFTICSTLASDPLKNKMKLPHIIDSDIGLLENEIDRMTDQLPELHSFILPGGSNLVSYCHLARCVCRRAERRTTALASQSEVPPEILRYLNRLSDYLFTLARYAAFTSNVAERKWIARS